MKPLFFQTPKESVGIISQLLKEEDWTTLARYIDTDSTQLDDDELISGKYFIEDSVVEKHHYKPFDPELHFLSSHNVDDICVVELEKDISDNQEVCTKATAFFFLHKEDKGYRIVLEYPDDLIFK